jgi:ELWxxDGT repeat protein
VLVRDFPSIYFNEQRYLTNVNGTLFFAANTGSVGYELWKSDGTSSGTVLVRDFATENWVGDDNLRELTNVNGLLYFSSSDETKGDELWKSDGTSSGTVLVRDIQPDEYGILPFGFTNVNGTLYFSANDGIHGHELWKSDGTSSGTVLVRDINFGGRRRLPRLPGEHQRHVVLLGQQWSQWQRALEVRRHVFRHHTRSGHQPERTQLSL